MSITIVLDSLERIEPENRHEIPLYRLVFKTKGRIDEFEFPILVPPEEFREEDAVRIAKSYLAHSLSDLAELTKEWALSEDEMNSLRLPQKPKSP